MIFHEPLHQPYADLKSLIGGNHDGFLEIERFGRLTETFGSRFPRLYRFNAGRINDHGVVVNGSFAIETSFFSIYEDQHQFAYEVHVYAGELNRHRTIVNKLPAAVFAAHIWDHNYQHFLVETYPRIWAICQIAELDDLPIIVSRHPHVREILTTCFPDRTFISLEPGDEIVVDGPVFCYGVITRNMEGVPEGLAAAIRFLRETTLTAAGALQAAEHAEVRKVFFHRKPDPSYQGNQRVLANFDEIEAVLQRSGVVTENFDGKTLFEKACTAHSVSRAISPVGANLMNLIFLPLSSHIMIIEHPIFKAHFFPKLYVSLGFSAENIWLFSETTKANPEDELVNCPYTIDQPAFLSLATNFLSDAPVD